MPPRPAPATIPIDPVFERRLDLTAEGMLTVEEAEAFSGLNRTDLYELMKAGGLAYAQKGANARRLIPKLALRRHLASRMTWHNDIGDVEA